MVKNPKSSWKDVKNYYNIRLNYEDENENEIFISFITDFSSTMLKKKN